MKRSFSSHSSSSSMVIDLRLLLIDSCARAASHFLVRDSSTVILSLNCFTKFSLIAYELVVYASSCSYLCSVASGSPLLWLLLDLLCWSNGLTLVSLLCYLDVLIPVVAQPVLPSRDWRSNVDSLKSMSFIDRCRYSSSGDY